VPKAFESVAEQFVNKELRSQAHKHRRKGPGKKF
jgi:hypothetical protein